MSHQKKQELLTATRLSLLPTSRQERIDSKQYGSQGIFEICEEYRRAEEPYDLDITDKEELTAAWIKMSLNNIAAFDLRALATYSARQGERPKTERKKRTRRRKGKKRANVPLPRNKDQEANQERVLDNYRNVGETAIQLRIGYERQLLKNFLDNLRAAGLIEEWIEVFLARLEILIQIVGRETTLGKELLTLNAGQLRQYLSPASGYHQDDNIRRQEHSQTTAKLVLQVLGTYTCSNALYRMAASPYDHVGELIHEETLTATPDDLGLQLLKSALF